MQPLGLPRRQVGLRASGFCIGEHGNAHFIYTDNGVFTDNEESIGKCFKKIIG